MIAIIGDFIKSKQIKERQKFQRDLQKTFDEINDRHRDLLASELTITLGDEFQALFNKANGMLRLMDLISFRMRPHKIRFGLGIGQITTEIFPEVSLGADGPAYWYARKAINIAHENNDYGRSNIHLVTETEDESVSLINEILKLTAFQASGWRESQIVVYEEILKAGYIHPNEINHQDLAEKIEILPSSLTRRLESSGIKRYMLARLAAESAIRRINDSKL